MKFISDKQRKYVMGILTGSFRHYKIRRPKYVRKRILNNGVEYNNFGKLHSQKEKEIYQKTTRPILRYPGGKTRIADKIVKEIPPHKTYVEPFFGGGSVFFKKPPAEKSVISDKDKELMDFYKFFRDIDVKKFNELDFTSTKKKFDKLKNEKPKNKKGKVYKFLYLNKMSYCGKMKSPGYGYVEDEHGMKHIKENIAEYKERLKPVKMYNKDFSYVIKKYDSPNTFFYLDPPYYKIDNFYREEGVTPKDIEKCVKNIKGKFILSYNNVQEVKKNI